ncbi:MAG: hypothetical protein QNK36_06470 [Colwellia sp.]|nr:hypothetical protein [Colwellia sp.]
MDVLDLEFYQKEYLNIINKKGMLNPFLPNVYQQTLNRVIEEKKRYLEPIRLRVLKCRQVGVSTWGASLVYHYCATDFFKNALIIAHDADSSGAIFEMTKRFWDFSPEGIRPQKKRSNFKEMLFDKENEESTEGLRSSIKIETANKLAAGRSKTIQCLHMSEKAFWRDAATLQTGLFQSIPLASDTIILDESTANGISGEGEQFYNDWNDSGFTNMFFKWTLNPEYELPIGPDFKPDFYELELMKMYKELTYEKLNFRRYKIKNEMGSALLNPETQFCQEYPFTEQEAFISSGRPVFDMEQIQRDIVKSKQFQVLIGEI